MEWAACYYSSSRPRLCTLSLVIHCGSSASACHVNQPSSWSGLSPRKPAITSSSHRSWRHPMIAALFAPVACVLWLCCVHSFLITVLRLISKRNTMYAWVIGRLGKKRWRGFNTSVIISKPCHWLSMFLRIAAIVCFFKSNVQYWVFEFVLQLKKSCFPFNYEKMPHLQPGK